MNIQSEAEFDWAGELMSDGQVDDPEYRETDDYAVTGLGDDIDEEDTLDNSTATNRNGTDHDDKYTVTGLGDNIAEEDKLENVIQANQNDPDPSDEYTVTGLGDDFAEDDKLENITDRNTSENEQDNRSVTDTSSENNDDRDIDRTRGRR